MKTKHTISVGITEDQYGYEAAIMVRRRRVSKRFPPDTPVSVMKEWRRRQHDGLSSTLPSSGPMRGSLDAEIARYLAQIKALASWTEVRSHLRAWSALYGEMSRWRLTAGHVRTAVGTWAQAKVSPKTINHRLASLRRLYRVLDGKRAVTPCDEIDPLAVRVPPPVTISPAMIRQVEHNLRELEHDERRNQKARVRFMVLATTGCRPSELMRAEPSDVDVKAGIWRTRTAKGGHRPGGLALTKDMRAAWRAFIAAEAWGKYSTRDLARILREAGWPKGVRVYQLRHNVGMTLAERGADLADISAFLGHTRPLTTRSHYVPVTHGRMHATAKLLEGRFARKAR